MLWNTRRGRAQLDDRSVNIVSHFGYYYAMRRFYPSICQVIVRLLGVCQTLVSIQPRRPQEVIATQAMIDSPRKARALPWTPHAGGVLRTTGPEAPDPHSLRVVGGTAKPENP